MPTVVSESGVWGSACDNLGPWIRVSWKSQLPRENRELKLIHTTIPHDVLRIHLVIVEYLAVRPVF